MSNMRFMWNISTFMLLIVISTDLVTSTPVDGPLKRCRREITSCPDGCKATMDANGCADCHCGVPFYRAPRRYCPKTKCPTDCGFKKNAMGCPACYCDMNSYYRRPIDILKYRPTLKQPLAMAAAAKRKERFYQTPLNAIIH
ncbi:hypothetical protein CHUAL_013924 [Chamberlinius hualienensis]